MLDIARESETTRKVPQADEIINMLKEQANTILSAVLGTTKLEAFSIGTNGNMPYYWQDPRSLQFNANTYNWIKSNLKAETTPIQLDQIFTDLYIQALSSVSYSLSTADQVKLNQAKEKATDQQGAVLRAWKDSFGSLPSGEGQPIDLVAAEIASKWAVPPTTLTAIQQSVNINTLLNNVPASGKPLVPVFSNWLDAIGSAISLQNNTTMNTAYLARALAAAQTPTDANGGLTLNDNQLVPAYKVNTPLPDIQNDLKNSSQAASLTMTVSRTTESEYRVNVEGGASFSFPVFSLLSLSVGGNAHYFESHIATTDNETTVTMNFPGVTLVSFGPAPFDMSASRNWFWMKPIKDAIDNGGKDVSGFKFSPDPQMDFSKTGPFAYLMGAVISNYPSMEITVKGSNYERIQKTFQQSVSVGISFLGIPLGIKGSESSYSNKVTTNASASTVTISLNPPEELVAGSAVDSVGWVLGVQPNYPAA
ncbi:MAG: lamin tail domain-containing protein [Candidatus Thiodiazotropha sp. (ex Epidulcina cf. delphinae)]|nr:lamin tail domain-containing protein [Candidatus Thiodiazotropha sp. (ex Epidulcina cf. delphinae)]